jgi:hypothetical protein
MVKDMSIEIEKGPGHTMKLLFESCVELDVIYYDYPAKKSLRVLPFGELLSREQILTVREVLVFELQEQVCGSLVVRHQAERLSLDWGSVYCEVGKQTLAALCQFLTTLDLTEPQAVYFYEVEGPSRPDPLLHSDDGRLSHGQPDQVSQSAHSNAAYGHSNQYAPQLAQW